MNNAVMPALRRLVASLLVLTSSAACGVQRMTAASTSPSPQVTAVATSSVTPTTPDDADVPPLSPQAQAAGFVDIRSVVPDVVVDLRYATAHNFVGAPMYPPDARCLVDQSMASGVAAAAGALRPDVLVFWDCYRPHDVQVRMWEAVPNPDWVARPGPYAAATRPGARWT